MNDINYQVAADAAIILKYGGVDQSVVKGLNKLKPYGFTRNVITVEEFRNEMGRQFAGSGQMSNIEFGGNYVTGDVKGQDQLKAYMLANTKFTDCRCYLNNDDFFMPDVITDTGSGFVTAGFKAGDTIILEGVTEEDDELKMRVVASVAAGILTLSNTVADLTDQAAGIAFTIHGGRF
jgi:hypothetical protein